MAMKTVMSWQPTPMKGGAWLVGVAITLAVVGSASGAATIEILACGLWQRGPVLDGYDET
jgi:hypothetical protein